MKLISSNVRNNAIIRVQYRKIYNIDFNLNNVDTVITKNSKQQIGPITLIIHVTCFFFVYSLYLKCVIVDLF